MGVVGGHVRILGRHGLKGPKPQIRGEGEDVGLGHQGELLGPVALPGQFKGELQAAVHPFPGVDGLLDRHFIRGAEFQETPGAGVQAFGVLPHHHKVDVFGALVLQGRLHPGIEDHGPRLMYWSSSKRALRRMPFSRMPGATSGWPMAPR